MPSYLAKTTQSTTKAHLCYFLKYHSGERKRETHLSVVDCWPGPTFRKLDTQFWERRRDFLGKCKSYITHYRTVPFGPSWLYQIRKTPSDFQQAFMGRLPEETQRHTERCECLDKALGAVAFLRWGGSGGRCSEDWAAVNLPCGMCPPYLRSSQEKKVTVRNSIHGTFVQAVTCSFFIFLSLHHEMIGVFVCY